MPDYPKMYAILCGAASDAVDRIQSGDAKGAERLLRDALSEAEELYVSAGEDGGASA